jgi:hypothetical protein
VHVLRVDERLRARAPVVPPPTTSGSRRVAVPLERPVAPDGPSATPSPASVSGPASAGASVSASTDPARFE